MRTFAAAMIGLGGSLLAGILLAQGETGIAVGVGILTLVTVGAIGSIKKK